MGSTVKVHFIRSTRAFCKGALREPAPGHPKRLARSRLWSVLHLKTADLGSKGTRRTKLSARRKVLRNSLKIPCACPEVLKTVLSAWKGASHAACPFVLRHLSTNVQRGQKAGFDIDFRRAGSLAFPRRPSAAGCMCLSEPSRENPNPSPRKSSRGFPMIAGPCPGSQPQNPGENTPPDHGSPKSLFRSTGVQERHRWK